MTEGVARVAVCGATTADVIGGKYSSASLVVPKRWPESSDAAAGVRVAWVAGCAGGPEGANRGVCSTWEAVRRVTVGAR